MIGLIIWYEHKSYFLLIICFEKIQEHDVSTSSVYGLFYFMRYSQQSCLILYGYSYKHNEERKIYEEP